MAFPRYGASAKSAPSIKMNIRPLQRLRPAVGFPADEGGELFGRAGCGEVAGVVEFLADVGLREDVHDLAIELVDDEFRRVLRRDQAEPDREVVEVFQTGRGGQ